MGKTLRAAVRSTSAPMMRHGGGLGIVARRDLGHPLRISVICPTRNRAERHPALYDVFQQQDHPHTDLWVLDDSKDPSSYLLYVARRDARVHYVHSAVPMTIGAARNEMLRRCSGDLVAHFDDDDVYAPNYLSTMAKRLVETNANLVKLASWTDRSEMTGRSSVYNGRVRPVNDLWGWGFSYVYRRYVATRISFTEARVQGGGAACEDYPFVAALRAAGMKAVLLDGQPALAEHVWHGRNNTGVRL